jgi:hypothetical protein
MWLFLKEKATRAGVVPGYSNHETAVSGRSCDVRAAELVTEAECSSRQHSVSARYGHNCNLRFARETDDGVAIEKQSALGFDRQAVGAGPDHRLQGE